MGLGKTFVIIFTIFDAFSRVVEWWSPTQLGGASRREPVWFLVAMEVTYKHTQKQAPALALGVWWRWAKTVIFFIRTPWKSLIGQTSISKIRVHSSFKKKFPSNVIGGKCNRQWKNKKLGGLGDPAWTEHSLYENIWLLVIAAHYFSLFVIFSLSGVAKIRRTSRKWEVVNSNDEQSYIFINYNIILAE